MRRTLLAFSIATMALTTAADHLIVVKVGGKSFAAKVEDTATGCAFMKKLPLTLDMTELNGNEKYRYGGYSYTRIGKLTSTDGLAKAVGNGTASVTFEKATSPNGRITTCFQPTRSQNTGFSGLWRMSIDEEVLGRFPIAP